MTSHARSTQYRRVETIASDQPSLSVLAYFAAVSTPSRALRELSVQHDDPPPWARVSVEVYHWFVDHDGEGFGEGFILKLLSPSSRVG